MADVSLLAGLSVGTLVVVLGGGVFLYFHNRRSQLKRGERPGGMAGPS